MKAEQEAVLADITEGLIVRKIGEDGKLEGDHMVVVGMRRADRKLWCISVASGDEGDLLIQPVATLYDTGDITILVDQKIKGRALTESEKQTFKMISDRLRGRANFGFSA